MTTIIGITTSGLNEQMVQSPYYDHYYVVPDLYVAAVRRAGGIPILLPPGETDIESVLELVDGMVVTGGGDICPYVYGGNSDHASLTRQDPERDRFEIGIIQAMIVQRDQPVLCVCRGMQVLNVALGGTMYEHIPDIRDVDMHRNADGFWTVHDVQIRARSKLAQAMQSIQVQTYSGHHQAVKTIGEGLTVVAQAPDGIVEGLEVNVHPWMIGVQWHPEKSAQTDPTQQALFDTLIRQTQQR
ncbi:MAG: gamma-glutamyl-gamma-aminobutyrate hydrolase family protein [Anaerolineae bacterium]